jgi:lipid-A-disaccharide synthase
VSPGGSNVVNPRRFLIVAGESSGDMYGADVAQALKARFPGCSIFGLGGQRMRQAGVELEGDIERTAAVGPLAALGQFRELFATFRRLVRRVETTPPDVAILIDFPDFNLRLAKRINRISRISAARIPVVYYISPQVWAWRQGRVQQIRELVTKMLVIFPFEEKLYKDAGVDVEFVGHPLIETVHASRNREDFFNAFKLDSRRPLVALLPGSRRKEVLNILPTLCATSERILKTKPDTQFVLPAASNLDRRLIDRIIAGRPITVVVGETYNVLRYARAAIVASGTATLEAALLGVPEVIVYRLSAVEAWFLGKFFLKVRLFGIVNIILGEEVVPELFQDRFTPELVSEAAMKLMDDVWLQSKIRGHYESLRRQLGGGNVPERVAAAIAGVLSPAPTTTRLTSEG